MALVEVVFLTLALILAAFFALAIHMGRRFPGHPHLPWMIAGIGAMASTLMFAAIGIETDANLILTLVLFTTSAALTCKTFVVLTGSERKWPASLGLATLLTLVACAAIIEKLPYIHATIPFHLGVSLLMGEAAWRSRGNALKDDVSHVINFCLMAMAIIFAIRGFGYMIFFDTAASFHQIKGSKYELATMLAMAVPGMTMTLLLMFRTLDQTADHFRAISCTDGLTGLLNRNAFITAAENAAPGSWLIVCDIDNFKRVNDSWGHAAGDMALKCFSGLLRSMNMTAARIGGEEFAIFLPRATAEQSRLVAEGLRTAFSLQQIDGLPDNIRLTASFGVAGWDLDDDFDSAFKQADAALYRAKAEGRDRVIVVPAGPSLPTARRILKLV